MNTEGTMLPSSFLPTAQAPADLGGPAAYRDVQAQAQAVDLTSTRAAVEIRSMPSEVDEISWIVDYLQKKNASAKAGLSKGHGSGATLDIAILTRSQDGLRRVVDTLRRANIEPRSRSFGSRVLPPEGTSPLNLLRLLAYGDDDIAFESALDNDVIMQTCSNAEVDDYVLPVIRRFVAEHEGYSMLEAARQCVLTGRLENKYNHAMNKFIMFFEKWRNEFERYWGNRERENLERRRGLVYGVLKAAYDQRWHEEFEEQVNELSKSVAPFDSLRQFFAELGYGGDFVVEAGTLGRMLPDVSAAREPDADTNAVTMPVGVRGARASPASVQVNVWAMVMHASKGLEFDEVMLPFWNEGVVPPQKGIPVEERKLAFVSLTRARERVLISYAQGMGRRPSPLVEELLSFPESLPVVFEDVPVSFFNSFSATGGPRAGASAGVGAGAGAVPGMVSQGARKSTTGAFGRRPVAPPLVSIMTTSTAFSTRAADDAHEEELSAPPQAEIKAATWGEYKSHPQVSGQSPAPNVVHRDLMWGLFDTAAPSAPPVATVARAPSAPPAVAVAVAPASSAPTAVAVAPAPSAKDEAPATATDKKTKKIRKASGPEVATVLEQLTMSRSEITRLLADASLSRMQLKALFRGHLDRLGVKKGAIPVAVLDNGGTDKRALSKCTADQLGAHLATLLDQQQQA